ncbi:hypothetical protein BS78_09G010200 [Paspalum vaginatum]|nr:hypothetical protein BS78_09G010200 [Paspalum vaginatum]
MKRTCTADLIYVSFRRPPSFALGFAVLQSLYCTVSIIGGSAGHLGTTTPIHHDLEHDPLAKPKAAMLGGSPSHLGVANTWSMTMLGC